MEEEDDFDEILNELEKQFEEGDGGEEEEALKKKAPKGEEEPRGREQSGKAKDEEELFDDLDELSKMAGVKPKSAAIISALDSVSLCSLCTLSEVPADCFGTPWGTFAVLDVSNRDPEQDAARITELFKDLQIVLIYNRDQKLVARGYCNGKGGEKIAPPLILRRMPNLESYLVGIESLKELKEKQTAVSSSSITKEEALSLLRQIFKSDF